MYTFICVFVSISVSWGWQGLRIGSVRAGSRGVGNLCLGDTDAICVCIYVYIYVYISCICMCVELCLCRWARVLETLGLGRSGSPGSQIPEYQNSRILETLTSSVWETLVWNTSVCENWVSDTTVRETWVPGVQSLQVLLRQMSAYMFASVSGSASVFVYQNLRNPGPEDHSLRDLDQGDLLGSGRPVWENWVWVWLTSIWETWIWEIRTSESCVLGWRPRFGRPVSESCVRGLCLGDLCLAKQCPGERCLCERPRCGRPVSEKCVLETWVWETSVWEMCAKDLELEDQCLRYVWEAWVWETSVWEMCVRDLGLRDQCLRDMYERPGSGRPVSEICVRDLGLGDQCLRYVC